MIGKLFDQFKLEVVGVLLLALIGLYLFHVAQVGLLTTALDEANGKIGNLQVTNSILTQANKQAKTDIDTQNAQIKALKDTMAAMSKEAEDMLAKVRKDADRWKQQYDALFRKPPPTKDECQAVSNLLSQYHSLRISEMREVAP